MRFRDQRSAPENSPQKRLNHKMIEPSVLFIAVCLTSIAYAFIYRLRAAPRRAGGWLCRVLLA